MASAIALEAVGIHFSVSKKPYATYRLNTCINNALVTGSFARPRLNTPTTDRLSTPIKTWAHRRASGYREQNYAVRVTTRTSPYG